MAVLPQVARRRRPGGQVAQAHRAVERLVAQGQRGHGAAAAAGRGSRRLSGASVRPPSASVRHCRAAAAFFRGFFSARAGAGRPLGQSQRSPASPPAYTLIYVPYIKRVFRVPLWIFLRPFYIRARCRGPRAPAPAAATETRDARKKFH